MKSQTPPIKKEQSAKNTSLELLVKEQEEYGLRSLNEQMKKKYEGKIIPNKLRKTKSKTTLLSTNDIGELFFLALKKGNPKIQKAAVKILGLFR